MTQSTASPPRGRFGLERRRGGTAWAPAAIVAFLVTVSLICIRSRGFEYDDSYIWFRYIENFAKGFGASFNANGDHYEGFSSPAWLLLSAAVRFLCPLNTRALANILGAILYAAACSIVILMSE